MTLLIPLLLRLTALFERGVIAEEPSHDDEGFADDVPTITVDKE